jgi:hypothetical protein
VSELVRDVRAVLAQHDRPLTAVERALLVAAVMRTDGSGHDVVDELALSARRVREAGVVPAVRAHGTPAVADDHAARLVRLLAAVEAVLGPYVLSDPPEHRIPPQLDLRWRADVDG